MYSLLISHRVPILIPSASNGYILDKYPVYFLIIMSEYSDISQRDFRNTTILDFVKAFHWESVCPVIRYYSCNVYREDLSKAELNTEVYSAKRSLKRRARGT